VEVVVIVVVVVVVFVVVVAVSVTFATLKYDKLLFPQIVANILEMARTVNPGLVLGNVLLGRKGRGRGARAVDKRMEGIR